MPQGYDERREREREYDRAENRARGREDGRSPGYDTYASSARWTTPSEFEPQGDQTLDEVAATFGGPDPYARFVNERDRHYWMNLDRTAPTVGELTPDYSLEADEDAFGSLLMGPSELEDYRVRSDGYQDAALEALRQLSASGGYTDADRTMSADLRRAAAMERGQMLRGANEAALQQSYARGMGGGGAELASRLAGSQAMAQGQAGYDASVNAATQQAAMQRALAAMQGMGSLGTQRQSNLAQQEMARRGALDNYNQANMDWRRGREQRNTGIANQQARDRADAYQQRFQNAVTTTEGATRFNTSQQQQREAEMERRRDVLAGIGGAVEQWTS